MLKSALDISRSYGGRKHETQEKGGLGNWQLVESRQFWDTDSLAGSFGVGQYPLAQFGVELVRFQQRAVEGIRIEGKLDGLGEWSESFGFVSAEGLPDLIKVKTWSPMLSYMGDDPTGRSDDHHRLGRLTLLPLPELPNRLSSIGAEIFTRSALDPIELTCP